MPLGLAIWTNATMVYLRLAYELTVVNTDIAGRLILLPASPSLLLTVH